MFDDPSLEISSSQPVAFQGSSVTLTCAGALQLQSAGPCSYTNCASFIPWSHGSDQLNGSISEEFNDGVLVVTSELRLNSITSSNAGYYSCQLNYGNMSSVLSIGQSVTG